MNNMKQWQQDISNVVDKNSLDIKNLQDNSEVGKLTVRIDNIEAKNREQDEQLSNHDEQLKNHDEQLENLFNKINKDVTDTKTEINNTIEQLRLNTNNSITALQTSTDRALDTIKQNTTDSLNSLQTSIDRNIELLKSNTADSITALQTSIDRHTEELDNLDEKIIAVDSRLDDRGIPTGTVLYFAGETAPNRYLPCNGANVSRTTYADLFAVIGTLYGKGDGINAASKFGTAVFDSEDGNLIRVTVATNESDASSFDVTTYFKGSLVETQTVKNATELANNSYIVWDTSVTLVAGDDVTFAGGTGTTFTLPNLIDNFVQGSTTVGTYKSAGLPDHDHKYIDTFPVYSDGHGSDYPVCSTHSETRKLTTEKASSSNAIYGNSETVQPPALTLLPCIKY